ncbi:MAG: MOSC domain-containing protein [Gemmatimonadaceae bacterium]|nr:MOSC domain-containing protein [Gemmatimonadaceae bacterium]
MSEQGVIVSINVSRGGVPKRSVPVASATSLGLDGDGQGDRRHHGGPDRALCLYSMERIEALQREGHSIAPGTTGENLTIRGLDWDTITPGVQLRAGGVTMEITAYASPCKSIRPSFSDENSNRISQDLHPGWSRVYARVVDTGDLRVGDAVVRGPSIHPVGD